jgi:8-oxo-dGTP diphosphatase
MKPKKTITCVAGVLWNDQGEVLIAQRPAHKPLPLLWEFPGGKIESGETPEQALHRELEEELGLSIDVTSAVPFTFISHHYLDFHVVILFFHVFKWQGTAHAKEDQEGVEWVCPHNLNQYSMPDADLPLIDLLVHQTDKHKKNC